MADALYQDSKQSFLVNYFDAQGNQIDANTVVAARYSLQDPSSNCVVTKELGSGITVEGISFKVTIEQPDIQVSGNNFLHQFSVGDSLTELEPPIFQNQISVIPVKRC